VGEEATIHHNGQDVVISVNMLHDIRKLGWGNYGSVMLVEVENHPEIKMAVKVSTSISSKSFVLLRNVFLSFLIAIKFDTQFEQSCRLHRDNRFEDDSCCWLV
jgi:hypothetical protein